MGLYNGDIKKYFNCNPSDINNKDFLDDYISLLNNNPGSNYLYDLSPSMVYSPDKLNTGNKKSVLLMIHELSRTGAPIVALDTAKVLVKNGYFVTVISLRDGLLLDEFMEIGVPVIVMNDLKLLQFRGEECARFVSHLDLDAFVYSFDEVIFITATLFNYVRRYYNLTKKLYWWIHEGSATYSFIGSLMPKTIGNNIKVFTGGQYASDCLREAGFLYYPSVLNYGVFEEKELMNKKRKKKDDKVVFMLAGTICYRKGQAFLLDAIKALSPDEMSKATFIFVGDPYDNDRDGHLLKERIQKATEEYDNIKLIKSLTRNELYDQYLNTDVLVIPSTDDPMPVVATENFMLGNICLVSDRTGTSYYINDKDNGFVFRSGDINELRDKLSYIIQNRDKLNDIKQKGQRIFEDYFKMDNFERKTLELMGE